MIDSVVNQLRQVWLFSALDEDDLEAVASLAQEKFYPHGALVCKQGEASNAWYIVEVGELRAQRVDRDGVRREVERFSPGGFFGERALLLGDPHEATVEVTREAELLTIDKESFDGLLEERPWILGSLQMSSEVEQRRCVPRFDWQEPDEAAILVLRKHGVALAERLVSPAVFLLAVLIGFFLWGTVSLVWLLLGGLLVAAPLLFALYCVVDHFNDRYILTNRRIVHDEHVFLIHRSRVGARLSNIQSVQLVQIGMVANSFDYGDLLIETAGEPGGLITFRQIPHPATVQKAIFRQIERVEAQVRAEERAAIEGALERRLRDGSDEVERSGIGEGERAAEEETQFTRPSWMLAPLRLVRYFFPPLREEGGDTITWRKHWVALLGPIARPTAAIALVTLIVAWLLGSNGDQLTILLSYGIVLLFLVPWWLWVFEDWQNEIYQVTPSRIIDIERRPLGLHEERREASLGRVQNVSLRMPGLIGRVFGYGSVTIETAGAGAFTFDYVKDPEDVQGEIFRYVEAFEERERQERARRRRDELLDWFTVYDQMRNSEGRAEGGQGLRPGACSGDCAAPSSD